jgi:hypothetical protein
VNARAARGKREKNLNAYVPNGVTRAHADPLGKRAVLLLLLPQNLLNLESLVGRLRREGNENSPVSLKSSSKSPSQTRAAELLGSAPMPTHARAHPTPTTSIALADANHTNTR